MKLLLDEGVPLRTADELRRLGVDAQHILELGMRGQTDEAVLARARQDGAVVVALDSDFHRLLAVSQATNPSVIRIRTEGLGYEALARMLRSVSREAAAALAEGALVSVTEDQIRIRRLPIEA